MLPFALAAVAAPPLYLLTGGLYPDKTTAVFHLSFAPFTFNATAGTPLGGVGPSFLALTPDRQRAYVANHDAGAPSSGVTALALSWTPFSFARLSFSSLDDPCHVALHPSGSWVLSASYTHGTVTVSRVLTDGSLAPPLPPVSVGDNAHEVVFDVTGSHVFVPCLGSDHIALLNFDSSTGALTPNADAATVMLPPKCGPRHLALHPTLPTAYALCELSSQVIPLAWDRASGVLAPGAAPIVSTLVGGRPGAQPTVQAAADVLITDDGRFLYATNRAAPKNSSGENSIAIFSIAGVADDSTGALTAVGRTDGGGSVDFPRHATLHPGVGNPLLVTANQKGDSYTVFSRDAASGALTLVGVAPSAPITSPSFVALLPG